MNAMAMQNKPANEEGYRIPEPDARLRHLANSGHIIRWTGEGRRMICISCHQTAPRSKAAQWLRNSRCPQAGGDPQDLMVGRVKMHYSHKLVWAMGIWICT